MDMNDISESLVKAAQERWRDQIDAQILDALLGPHSTGVAKVSMGAQGIEVRHIPYSQMVDVTSS
jgi:hypothetical protein